MSQYRLWLSIPHFSGDISIPESSASEKTKELQMKDSMKKRILTGVAAWLLLGGTTIAMQAQQDQPDQAKPSPQQSKPSKTDSKPSEGKAEPGGQTRPGEQQKEKRQTEDQSRVQKEQQKQLEEQQKRAQHEQQKQTEDQQQQKQASEQRERAQVEDKDRQNDRHEAQAQGSRPGRPQRGARIPDDRFREHFGRNHKFHVERIVLVENRPRFQYTGYWFELVNPWPADWSYSDDCYIDYIDERYFLIDPAHPGIRLAVIVVG